MCSDLPAHILSLQIKCSGCLPNGFSKTNIDFTIICYIPFIFDTVYKCYRIFLLLCLFNVTFLSSNLLLKSICWWLFNKNTHIFTIMIKSENMKRYLYWHMFLFSLIKVHRNEQKEVYYGNVNIFFPFRTSRNTLGFFHCKCNGKFPYTLKPEVF